ncbi:DMT family transporter [Arthrobacter sp. MMS24-T111]|jgi:drug/metabolite transporter (DMT)-like permease
MAVVWGSSFLFMKVASTGLSPGQIVLGRVVLGAASLLLVQLLTRRGLPLNPKLRAHAGVLACFRCVVPFLLYASAVGKIPSGLSSIFNAATPLITAAATLFVLRQETVRLRQLIALLAGGAGVLLVLSPWRFQTESWPDMWSQLARLGAALSLGAVFAYTRRFVSALGEEPAAVATVQMLLAAAIMGMLGPALATQDVHLGMPVVLSMLTLGVLSTGFAYIWSFGLIARVGAVAASSTTYVMPLVGVALGVFVLQERVTWNELRGGAVVILSLIAGSRPSKEKPE